MTEAVRRHSFDAALSQTGVMDASGLQALAAAAVSAPPEAVADGAARRGPFRPEVWLNARQRHASRLAAHYFRAFDSLAVVAVSLLCAWAAAPGARVPAWASK